jgi:hypothetical protein
MMQLIHMTAAYSNAVLVAILPHVSVCASQLGLPIPQPITAAQVRWFHPSPFQDEVGGGIDLTNHYFFSFSSGSVLSFRSPTNWFNNTYDNWDDAEYFKRYVGKDNMTTNEAIELARHSFYKLGYKPEDFDIRGPPTRFDGPANLKNIGHVPYCRAEWDSPNSRIQRILGLDFNIQFDIDMQRRQVVGMNLSGRRFFRPNPKVGVTPELETDYRNAGVIGHLAQTINKEPAVHVTAAYSNATLTATLPYIADFASKLNLAVSQPLASNQVLLYLPPLYYTNDGFRCTIMLTNRCWFSFMMGFVSEFGSPNDWFEERETRTNWPGFDGKNCMTTNEAIEFARNAIRQLGYKPEDFHMDKPPSEFENALDSQNKRYAYCRVDWESPDNGQTDWPDIYQVQFNIDTLRKQIVGATLVGREFTRPLPKIDVAPELESDYLKRIQGKMFVRTNAPAHYPPTKPVQLETTDRPDILQTNSTAPR